MRKKLSDAWKVVTALAVLGGLAWVVYVLSVAGLRWLSSLRSEVATAIVAAAATVLVSLLSVAVSKFLERRDAFERETRLKKVPIYERLISFIFSVLQQGKPGIPKMADAEMVRTYTSLTESVIAWGSDNVLKQFGAFRVASLQIGHDHGPVPLLVALEDLMLATRRDLGFENSKIDRGDILRLFINDLEQQRDALRLLRP